MTRVSRLRIHPATLAVAPLVVLAVVVFLRADWFIPRFDYAVQELGVQEAVHGQRLLGPYSRFGFFHPGPVLFYVAAPAFELLGKSGGLAMVLMRLCLDAACIALIVVLVDRIGGRTAAWGATVGLMWVELRLGLEWFRDPWNPYAVVLPTALALVAGAALNDGPRGRRWRAVVLVLSASFAAQTHIGSLPLVSLALGLGVVGLVRSSRGHERGHLLRDLLPAVCAGLICWALPIWEQLTSSPGNVHDIAAFFAQPATGQPGLRTVLGPVTGAVTLFADHMGNVLGAEPFSVIPAVNALWWCVLVALVGVVTWFGVSSWRAGRAAMAALALSVPVGYLFAVLSGLQIRGGVQPYLFAPALAVGVVAWLAAGAAVAELVTRVTRAQRARLFLAAAAVAIGIGTVWVGSSAFDPLGDSFGSAFALRLQAGISAVCRSDRPVRLVSDSATWYQASEVGAAIGECTSDVKLDRKFRNIVGARRTDADSAKNVLVVRLESPAVPRTAGWKRVARSSDASLDISTVPLPRLTPGADEKSPRSRTR